MILDEWRSSPTDGREAIILPDGCRDVICRYSKGHTPEWFVSPLYDQATKIRIEPGTTMVGYRLQPVAIINEWELMQFLGVFLANNDMTGVIQHSGYDGVSTGEHISTKKPLGSVT